VTTDQNGNITNLIDYLPYGTDRVNVQVSGNFNNRYTFTDQEKDTESGLMNFDARQYNQNVGRFLSQDPLTFKIALTQEVKNTTGQDLQKLLQNPQILNSYAYVGNNPVKYTDPDGQFFFLIPAIPYIFTGVVALLGAYSAWQTGATLGYALEQDYANSELAAAKNQLALTGIATAGEGALAVMPFTIISARQRFETSLQKGDYTLSKNRMNGYVLNLNNPSGKDKAYIFNKELGFNQKNSDLLIKQIKENIENREYTLVEKATDQYGTRFSVDMNIRGVNDKNMNIRTGWILDKGSNKPRFLTMYPSN